MLSQIAHHYRRSREVHRLVQAVSTANGLPARMETLRQIQALQKDYNPRALPKWVERVVEWYVGNALPVVIPFGSYRPNFLRRILLPWRAR